MAIGAPLSRHDDGAMQLISEASAPARRPVGRIVSATLVGAILVAGGLALAYVAFATPMFASLLPSGRLEPGQMATGMVVMATALVAPITFVAIGTNRLARLLAALRPSSARLGVLEQLVQSLSPDVTGAADVPLYDGRTIPAMLIGPFGVIVLREAPPAHLTRVSGSSWELRTPAGWAPIESPVERAARDADRVRQWLSHDDRDFLVKTYAAVIAATERSLTRSAACTILTIEQVPAFIASLPAQRSLTVSRREGILDQVREAVSRS